MRKPHLELSDFVEIDTTEDNETFTLTSKPEYVVIKKSFWFQSVTYMLKKRKVYYEGKYFKKVISIFK